MKSARRLNTPAGRLLIYKDDHFSPSGSSSDNLAEHRRYSPGEMRFLDGLDEYFGGKKTAMVPLNRNRDTDLLGLLKKKFREKSDSQGVQTERVDAGFLALKELEAKVSYGEAIGLFDDSDIKYSLPDSGPGCTDAGSARALEGNVILPGTLLVAHPLLTGYFARTTILIVSHSATKEGGGTYGLIVDKDVGNVVADKVKKKQRIGIFGKKCCGIGGPVDKRDVHMIHSSLSGEKIGGVNLNGLRIGGSIPKAIEAVKNGECTLEEFKFVRGNCVWEPGQLEAELEGGFWTVCETENIGKRVISGGEGGEKGLWGELMSDMGFKEESKVRVKRDFLVSDLLMAQDSERVEIFPSNYIE